MAEAPRTSPLPPIGRGILTPVELSPRPVIGGFPGPLTEGSTLHQARVTMRPPIPGGQA